MNLLDFGRTAALSTTLFALILTWCAREATAQRAEGAPSARRPLVSSPDLNADGVVDGADLGLFQTMRPDINGDGVFDSGDLGAMLQAWGQRVEPTIRFVMSHWGRPDFWSEAPGFERAYMAHGETGAWPRLLVRDHGLEVEHEGMVHWAAESTLRQHIAGVRAWAARHPRGDVWTAFDYEWDYLPWSLLKDFKRDLTMGEAEAYETAWKRWYRATVEELGGVRGDAKRAWFVTKRWHAPEAVAATAPLYGEIEGVIVSIYTVAEIVPEDQRDPPFKRTYDEVVDEFTLRLTRFVTALEDTDTEVIAGLNFRVHQANPSFGEAQPLSEIQARASLEAMERAGVYRGWLWTEGVSEETREAALRTAQLYEALLAERILSRRR